MTSHLFLRGSLATLFALGSLGVARTAGADPASCTADSDCTKGFTCQVVGATACPGTACAVPPAGIDVIGSTCISRWGRGLFADVALHATFRP
jgi:hypothetical protein